MNNIQTRGGALTALRILYFALLGGSLMFAAVIFFASRDEARVTGEFKDNIMVIDSLVAAAMVTISFFIWRKDLLRIQQGADSLPDKFNSYRAAAIKRYAFLEFAMMFSIVCYFLTKDPLLYMVLAILAGQYLSLMPSAAKIANDLGESAENIEAL